MANQIIKQPNGLYCIYSTIVDNVIFYDMTIEQIIENFVEDYRKEVTRKVNEIVCKIDKGEKPYHVFSLTFDEMLLKVEEIHGKKEVNKLKKLFDV